MSRFSSKGDHFEGTVVTGSFVRSGIVPGSRMCLTLDTDRLQDAPGLVTTSDGRFERAPLRPIPQIWHDPLSTLSFGEGRLQNLIYAATPNGDAGVAADILVVVSLMQSDSIEVRLLRGAPTADAGASGAPGGDALFGLYNLDRQRGACAF